MINIFRSNLNLSTLVPNKKWTDLSVAEKKTHIIRLLDHTENSEKKTRDDVNRAILYLAQGIYLNKFLNKIKYFIFMNQN